MWIATTSWSPTRRWNTASSTGSSRAARCNRFQRAKIGWMIARVFAGSCWVLLLASAAQAQMIPSGTPLPSTTLPPVVFINGYQFEGCPATFSGTFGIADQVLQGNGEVSVFFNTCSLSSSASIEDLAAAFAAFLSGLSYTDGQPVDQVDVVAHSMGGLVLRSYLSEKQNTGGMFQPPAATLVRKAVFLATPHAGT